MNLIEKIRRDRLERHSGFTIFDDIFIPMFIGARDEMQTLLQGNIVLNPAADEPVIRELLSKIPGKYIGTGEWEAVSNGGFANLAELLAKQTSMYPLVYEEGRFMKPDRRFRKGGDTAVIIMYPDVFLQRFQGAVGMCFANQYYGMFASAQYRGISGDPDKFSYFNRNNKEHWKKELILSIRMNPNLRVADTNMTKLAETIALSVGDLADIAVMCPVKDLLKGQFPKKLLDLGYKDYLDSFKISKKEVKQWVLNVAANVMSITPTTEWMDKLADIFPKDKWKPVSQVEKLYYDGDGMPRLAFFENYGRDRVFIHINRIEFHFFDYNDNQKAIVRSLLHFAETECKTGFCHMMLETHADLGVIRDKRILSQTGFREERTCKRENLFEYQFIEADFKLVPSVMGREMVRKDWHYAIRVSTPDDENTMWYDADTVMDFFNDVEKSNMERINYLMKGNAYGRYRKI